MFKTTEILLVVSNYCDNMSLSNFGNLAFTKHFNAEDYSQMYLTLKSKYAKTLIDNWTECTDPHKFVHEDLGIASFLLLLWKNQPKCNFVDLGCGNGLLVYILTQEGHHGIGQDVRKRKIWDTYPNTTILQEHTIVPSKDLRYPNADWLIGNHSDELTAWLPIVAFQSNSWCNFFTIPCCPFKLNGDKFQRRRANLSVYQDFLEYTQEIGMMCGFEVAAEKMKIPSTKRICLVGRRTKNTTTNNIPENLWNFLATSGNFTGTFKPRSSVELVRNCTQISKDIQQQILLQVQAKLLDVNNEIILECGRKWNQGGKLDISELASALPADLLQKLKSECKGLQTLLKNHHQVFSVNSGQVQLRTPVNLRKISESSIDRKDFKWKKKACWFHQNHPNSCPLLENECSYAHLL